MATITFEHNIAHVHLPEKSNVNDFIEAMGKIFSNPEYRKMPYSLWHIHETELDVTPSDLQKIKEFVSGNRGNIPRGVAAVVVKSTQQKGTILIYELITYELPVDLKIFMDYDEALKWVQSGLPK